MTGPNGNPGTEPLDIGQRLELFVDYYLIENLEDAELRLHRPHGAGMALNLDRPWEGRSSGHFTVILDKGKYKLYYRGWPYKPELSDGRAPGQALHVTCYAESTNGKTWVRPDLRLHEVHGTLDNNVIFTDPQSVTARFSPFLDTGHGVPETERYKSVSTIYEPDKFTLALFVSADGLQWKRMGQEVIVGGFSLDSQNTLFWSEREACYVCLFRTKKYVRSTDEGEKWVKLKDGTWERFSRWSERGDTPEAEEGTYLRYRWITRTTSKDLREWTPPVDMDFGDAPPEDLYTNQTEPYFRAPHIYIGTAARFFPGRQALTPGQQKQVFSNPTEIQRRLLASIHDAVLLTSRGGERYDRTFMESLVRPGPNSGNWVYGSNFPAKGVVPTGDREMSMYVVRNSGQESIYLERVTLRTDGFASLSAPYRGGQMVTKPLMFSGRELVLNFESSAAGGIFVEIQDEAGKVVKGFALSDCDEIIGDDIERVVKWKSGPDVSNLAERPVRLRFAMKDADLYSIRFR